MYQTARSQRFFIGHFPPPKTDKNSYIQRLEKDGRIISILHERPCKSAMDSFNFHLKHNIKSGHVINNGWKVPKGKELRLEYNLILQKKSKLSSKQRNKIVLKITT